MESKSTYLRAKIGGFHGRSLQKGDQIMFDSPSRLSLKMIHTTEQEFDRSAI